MNSGKKYFGKDKSSQSGVALVTVLMISVLLMIACIAMLSAVGAHSRNVTDVLSESKAYYAAESGLQATINVLRGNTDTTPTNANDDLDYKKAVTPSMSNYSGDPTAFARLSTWLNYNYPVGSSAPERVVIGTSPELYNPNTDVAYKVKVYDPDYTQSRLIFSTNAASVSIPAAGGDRIDLSFTNVSNHNLNFLADPVENPLVTTIKVNKWNAGATTGQTRFKIDFIYKGIPGDVTKSIRGTAKITADGANLEIKFDSYALSKKGSEIYLCASSACSPPVGAAFAINIPITEGAETTAQLYAKVTPIQPYRLVVNSTGFGPSGSRKELEAVIHSDLLDNLTPGTPLYVPGPMGPGFLWNFGQARHVDYCGVDTDSDTDNDCEVDPNAPVTTVPSVLVGDPDVYAYILAHPPQTAPNPPAELIGTEAPEWALSPESIDELVGDLRSRAQNSLRYYPSGVTPPSFGEFDTGRGITFCDGDCIFNGSGGGILIVTGKLTLSGRFSFKGLILITGQGGVDRLGGGDGRIIGSMVVAGYNPNDLDAGFYPPRYDLSGGGNSDLDYSSASLNFEGQRAVSDFMQGVAEK